MSSFGRRLPGGKDGQAMVELLVVLPVLLLLLLGAAEMGKLLVITGKSEIAARYCALRHFRGYPFGDIYPGYTRAQEIERIFFDDALDDSGLPAGQGSEPDDPDVTYTELGDDDLLYAPSNLGDPLLMALWDYFDVTEGLFAIRGVRSSFAYDLPLFPFGRRHPLEDSQALEEIPSEGRFAATYNVAGNFVTLTSSFTGQQGENLRLLLVGTAMSLGFQLMGPSLLALIGVLWLIFLP